MFPLNANIFAIRRGTCPRRTNRPNDRPLRSVGAKNSNAVRAVVDLFFTQGSDKSSPRSRSALAAAAVAESPDTFRSRPESKKPFQSCTYQELALTGTRAHTLTHTIARPSGTYIHSMHAIHAALCERARLCTRVVFAFVRIYVCTTVCACEREGVPLCLSSPAAGVSPRCG